MLGAEGAVHGTQGSVAGTGRKHGGGGVVAAQGAVGVRAPEAPQAAQAAVAADQQAGAGRASPRQPDPGIAGACSACNAARRWDIFLAYLHGFTDWSYMASIHSMGGAIRPLCSAAECVRAHSACHSLKGSSWLMRAWQRHMTCHAG